MLAKAVETVSDIAPLLVLGAVTGMRRGELAGLQWKRVDLAVGSLLVEVTVNDAGGPVVIDDFTKTRRARWVGIDEYTASLLTDLRARMDERAKVCGTKLVKDAFVFTHSADGATPVRPEYLTRRMRALRRRLDLELADFDTTLHSLRHWTQTALNEAGFNPRQVAAARRAHRAGDEQGVRPPHEGRRREHDSVRRGAPCPQTSARPWSPGGATGQTPTG